MERKTSNFPTRILERKFFPEVLLELSNPPERLYVRGELPKFDRSWIAMVGTRRPSPYAEDICRKLVQRLRGTDAVVVSGLAQGIDSFCHASAIAEGIPTVAVIAQGLDVPLEGSRSALAKKILESGGAILTEYPAKIPPAKFTFPARNRIIAGLCKSTTLVESKVSGGGMHTVRHAQKLGRPVLCVPGNILFETSQGPNREISQKRAHPVWEFESFPELCGARRLSDPTSSEIFNTGINLGKDAQRLFLENAGFTSSVEALCAHSGLPVSRLLAILTELEIAGLVRSRDGSEFHFLNSEKP